jgi:CCR4-NOT transcriptional regulation complex NOT5 subunit
MTREDIIRMAREANILEPMGFDKPNMAQWRDDIVRELERFAALVRADERERIEDEWSMCVQSDLEHGVKSLNEQAAKDWFKNYPEIAKFGAWLAARGRA